jgi:hypothetical protein
MCLEKSALQLIRLLARRAREPLGERRGSRPAALAQAHQEQPRDLTRRHEKSIIIENGQVDLGD